MSWHSTVTVISRPPPRRRPNHTAVDVEANFMGLTLWDGNLKEWEGGHLSHLDMLHNSPNGAGIAWEQATSSGRRWLPQLVDSLRLRARPRDVVAQTTPTESSAVLSKVKLAMFQASLLVLCDAGRARLLIADSGNNRIAVLQLAAEHPPLVRLRQTTTAVSR